MNDPLGLFDEDTKGNDPLGLFEEKAGIGTGIKSSFANVGNMADTAFSTLAGGAAALFGDDKAAMQIEEDMRSRLKSREQWANPEGQEISGTGKLAGAVATLPMQILGMGLSPADTALKAKDAGESNKKALQAAGLDATGNVVGMLLPGFKQGSAAVRGVTGFGANAAQDYATKSVIQDVLETDAGKKIFAPTLEDALISGVIGSGSAVALGRNKVSGEKAKLDTLLEKQKAIDAIKAVEAPAPILKNLSSLEGEDGQMSLFDQQDMVQNRQPYQAEFGDWRIDENGMPIKADLSMEAQNLQQPLQRNLWGDELPPKSEQEAFPLTQAIDEMPDAPRRNERDEGLDLLRGEIEAPGELKDAIMEAEGPIVKAPFNFKKQGGGLLIDPNKGKAKEQIESIIGKKANAISDNPVAADVVQQALSEGKDSKDTFRIPFTKKERSLGNQFNLTESGAISAAMKRGSAAIEGASRIIQNAVKRADLAIRNKVFPAVKALRDLPLEQLLSLADVFKAEMLSNTKFDGQAMADSGFSVEQIKAYTAIREMLDDTLRVQNEVRVAQGKKPIDEKEAYVSSRWQGDFRRPIFHPTELNHLGEPKVVWYLAADTKLGLEKQTKALLEDFPDLVVNKAKDHVVKATTNKTDLQSIYSTMLDILGRDDPAIARIEEAINQQTIAQGRSTLGQEKHFKQKGNVRGYVGDRPGSSPKREALGLFQQQMQYAKNAYKWAEFQKAADDIKTIVSNPELQQQQPNNVKYIREYWKNAIGYGEAKAIAAIEDGIRDMGVSPQVIKNGVGSIKSFFILQKLAASAGYTAANLIQTTNVLPYMADLAAKGYKGNPLKALSMGLVGGFAMGTGHYLTSAGGDYAKIIKGWPDGEFYTNAFKYAEDNGVTARSVYDESPVETSFSRIGQAANMAGKTMTIPETFVRSMAFMTYVQQLKDSGKFKTDQALFQKAEELVNMSMVDYRETERPMMFSKLGTTGNFLNTLQTFPMSFYNQWNFYAREAAKGNVGPILTAIVLQGTIAGAMGIPGFDDLDKLYMALKDMLPAKEWQKVQESELFRDPKMWMLKNLGESSVYGVLSDKTGLGMTSRVAAPGAGAMLQSPAGPITDIFKQGVNVGKAALDPTNTTKLAQAAMSVAPVGLQGALETAPFMEGITHNQTPNGANYLRSTDLADRKGGYVRTPKEENLRKWGFRSQKEVATRDITYSESRATKTAREKSQLIPDKFYDALRRGRVDEAKELNTVYTKLTGKGINDKQLENQVREELFDAVQRSKNAAKSLEAMKNIKRMDDLLKEIQ